MEKHGGGLSAKLMTIQALATVAICAKDKDHESELIGHLIAMMHRGSRPDAETARGLWSTYNKAVTKAAEQKEL